MYRTIEHLANGDIEVTRADGERLYLEGPVSAEALTEAVVTFFGPDMSMPETIPMHQVRLFLLATNRKAQVLGFLNSLAEPKRAMAKEEFEYRPDFRPDGPLGRATQAALGLNDAEYAEAMRDMLNFNIDDYGAPRPTLLAAIAKFFLAS